MLSYISLHKENWKEHSYVALCSVAAQALLYILKTNPQINEVHLWLDHDKSGIEGNYWIAELAGKLGDYKMIPEVPRYKDWNERLKKFHGIEPIPATEHLGLMRMKQLCIMLITEFGFEEEYVVIEHGNRKVVYAEKKEIIEGIRNKYQLEWLEESELPPNAFPLGGQLQTKTQLRTTPKMKC